VGSVATKRSGHHRTGQQRDSPLRHRRTFVAVQHEADRGVPARCATSFGARAANQGARSLRVDVWTTNDKLQQYYRDQGFTHVRTVVLSHNPSGAVLQRPARRVRTPRLVEVAEV
jgi:hypothetical protein